MQSLEQAGLGEGHRGGEVAVGGGRAWDIEADDEDAGLGGGDVEVGNHLAEVFAPENLEAEFLKRTVFGIVRVNLGIFRYV